MRNPDDGSPADAEIPSSFAVSGAAAIEDRDRRLETLRDRREPVNIVGESGAAGSRAPRRTRCARARRPPANWQRTCSTGDRDGGMLPASRNREDVMGQPGRLLVLIACFATALAAWPSETAAQRRRPAPVPQHRAVTPGSVVFIGGYFYDPFFGPYPWWTRAAYPHRYHPMFDSRAVVRVIATPKDAAVYVDGFYAGTVHDFNDWWQGLPLAPGAHEIVLFLDGYRTARDRVYLAPGSTFKLYATLAPAMPGEPSQPPWLAPPVPPPPAGTYLPPRTGQPARPLPWPPAESRDATATLSLRVQPADAEVVIDGERWSSSDGVQFVIELPAGLHRLRIARPGYRPYASEIQLRDRQTTRLNVTLVPETQ
jgi:hypothetical protein